MPYFSSAWNVASGSARVTRAPPRTAVERREQRVAASRRAPRSSVGGVGRRRSASADAAGARSRRTRRRARCARSSRPRAPAASAPRRARRRAPTRRWRCGSAATAVVGVVAARAARSAPTASSSGTAMPSVWSEQRASSRCTGSTCGLPLAQRAARRRRRSASWLLVVSWSASIVRSSRRDVGDAGRSTAVRSCTITASGRWSASAARLRAPDDEGRCGCAARAKAVDLGLQLARPGRCSAATWFSSSRMRLMPARLMPCAGQPRDLAQQLDVAQRVAPAAAGRAAGRDQAEPVVLAQGLRVQAGQLGGHRDDVHRVVSSVSSQAPSRPAVNGMLTFAASNSPARGSSPAVASRNASSASRALADSFCGHRDLDGDQQVARGAVLAGDALARAPGRCGRWRVPAGSLQRHRRRRRASAP